MFNIRLNKSYTFAPQFTIFIDCYWNERKSNIRLGNLGFSSKNTNGMKTISIVRLYRSEGQLYCTTILSPVIWHNCTLSQFCWREKITWKWNEENEINLLQIESGKMRTKLLSYIALHHLIPKLINNNANTTKKAGKKFRMKLHLTLFKQT